MRTRALDVPVLMEDETIIVDVDDLNEATEVQSRTMVGIPVQVGRESTRDMDMTLRHPAESRFFVRSGFEIGAPTDVIADSIAAGEVIGPACLARDNWILLVNLSDPAVPADRRIAAWRPSKVR